MWTLMTDRYDGMLPLEVTWGKGMRGFAGVDAPLVFVFEEARKFATEDEAEGEAFVLAISMPELIGHLHVLPLEDAGVVHAKEFAEWYEENHAALEAAKKSKADGTGIFTLAG